MQIRTEGPTREEAIQIVSENKTSQLSEKAAPSSGPNFMDLMKSIQLRSQKALEEGQKTPEVRIERNEEKEEVREPELFSEVEEKEEEIVEEDSETEADDKVSFLEKKKIQNGEFSDEDDLEWEELDPESPFAIQMTSFLANLEPKNEKEALPKNKEEAAPVQKIVKQSKQEATPQAEKEEIHSSHSKPSFETEKRPLKENKKSPEKESLEEGLKNLEEVRKFSRPANEEKAQAALKEIHKENIIPESENWKITREKKQESFSQISKAQVSKVASADESKGDTSGKGAQNQEFSQRQGQETTLTLLKAGMGIQEKSAEISNSSNARAKSNSTPLADRSAMKENFQRLVQSAKLNIVENGRSEATLRLNPRELGRVSLRISVEEDRVQGKIVVESDQVRRLFAGDLEQLKKDFRDQGLQLESLSIEVEDSMQFSWNGSGSDRANDSEGFSEGVSSSASSSSDSQVSELDSIEISESAEKNTERRLNVLV